MKSMKFTLNAITLQYLLIVACIIVAGGIVWIFIQATDILSAQAKEVNHVKIQAELAQDEIVRLRQLKINLAEDKDIINKTAQIVSESQQYKFQDQLINELSQYAAQAGIGIDAYNFGSKPGEYVTSTPNAAGATSTPSTSSKVPPKTLVTITMQDDASYTSFLKFIKSIEKNISKMQLTGINIAPNLKKPGVIRKTVIEIEVFLR